MAGRDAIPNYSMVSMMQGSRFWRWRQPHAGLAFTGHSLVAANVATNGAHERRIGVTELPSGLIESSAAAPNIRSESELARIVDEALAAVGAARERLALVLPDLAITAVVVPGGGQGKPRRSKNELRHELAASLPYPVREARCDFWWGRSNEVLAAAVRDVVVEQYERVAEAVGCAPGWVDGASLCQIPGQVAHRAHPEALEVHVQLYAGHYWMSIVRGEELVGTRTKLRAEDDREAVVREVLRAPVLHDNDVIDLLCLSGSGAAAVQQMLGDNEVVREIRVVNDDESDHLVSSIERLLERGTP